MRLIANLFQIPQSLNNGDPASTDFSPLDNTYANILYKPITNGGATAAEKKKEYIPIQARVYETQIKLGHYQLLGFEVFNIGQDKKVNTEDDYMSFFAPKKEDFIMNLPSEIADHLLPVNFAVSANTETNIVVPITPYHDPDRSSEMGNISAINISIYGINLKWLDFRLGVKVGYIGQYIGNYKLIIQRGSDIIADHTFGELKDDQATRWISILYDPAKTDDIDLSVTYKDENNQTFKGVKTIRYKDWLEKFDPHDRPYSIMRSPVFVHLLKT